MKTRSKPAKILFVSLFLTIGSAVLTNCTKDEIIKPDVKTETDYGKTISRAVDPNLADASINGYNNAFLTQSGGRTYYKAALNNGNPDGFWTLALSIMGMQDTYERTGTAAHRTLVNDLCTSYLQIHPPPYTWDGWNDDIAWVGLMLARGYQMTGTANLRTQAEYCFNLVYNRGWDTQYNGGGIWEQQPDMTPNGEEIIKEALSNNTTGKLGCLLFEITGNTDYRTKAQRIWDWSRSRIYNASTGEVYRGIYRDNTLSFGPAVYNQGTFVDFAAHLYRITGDAGVLADAQKAADYVVNNLTSNGIISNNATYLNTWADEYARGLGHLCRWNTQLWNKYYNFMSNNANAAWNNRRTDFNITANAWAESTPTDPAGYPTRYVSAVAMLQFTPPINPTSGSIATGVYRIINRNSGKALDASGAGTSDNTSIIQYTYSGASNQRWRITNLGNNRYNIINENANKAVDVTGASRTPGTACILYGYNGGSNQQFTLASPSPGYYTLFFLHDYQVLDVNASSTANNATVLQWGYNGGNNQQWQIAAP